MNKFILSDNRCGSRVPVRNPLRFMDVSNYFPYPAVAYITTAQPEDVLFPVFLCQSRYPVKIMHELSFMPNLPDAQADGRFNEIG